MRNNIYQESFAYYDSDGMKLKLYMARELEKILKDLSGDDEGRIADINFAYYNSWLLDSLRTRGEHIIYGEWDKLNRFLHEKTNSGY